MKSMSSLACSDKLLAKIEMNQKSKESARNGNEMGADKLLAEIEMNQKRNESKKK